MARKRKSVSTRTRFEVFKRDRFACQYCGRTPPAVTLEIDHVIPVADGGDNDEGNLLTACFDCNRCKSDVPLSDIPPPLADQIEELKERSAQVEAYNEFLLEERERTEGTILQLGYHWHNKFMEERDAWVFSGARVTSIRTFLKRLASAEIMEAMDIAFERFPSCGREENYRVWKYFCGVCWGKIRERDNG